MRPILAVLLLATLSASSPTLAGSVEAYFQRGDSNLDGALNIADPVATLEYLFAAGTPLECLDAADTNDDGQLNIADAVYTLNYLFTPTSPAPPDPFGTMGNDPTTDALTCTTVDCQDPAIVNAGLSVIQGTVPLPGAIPAQTISQSGVTVEVQQADAELTVDSVTYDPITHTFAVLGTAGAPAVPVTISALFINVSCNVAITSTWSLTGALDAVPVADGASEIVGVTPGSIVVSVDNIDIDFSQCGGLGAISGILNTIFVDAIQGTIGTITDQIALQVTDAFDQLLGAAPLIVCD